MFQAAVPLKSCAESSRNRMPGQRLLHENQFPAVEAKRGEASVAREVEEFLRCLAYLTSSFYEIVSIGNA